MYFWYEYYASNWFTERHGDERHALGVTYQRQGYEEWGRNLIIMLQYTQMRSILYLKLESSDSGEVAIWSSTGFWSSRGMSGSLRPIGNFRSAWVHVALSSVALGGGGHLVLSRGSSIQSSVRVDVVSEVGCNIQTCYESKWLYNRGQKREFILQE